MAEEEGLVQPVRGKSSPVLGRTAVLSATLADLRDLCRMFDYDPAAGRRLYTSRIYAETSKPALAGPLVGAPYAVMVLETLIAWGASRFLFVGWCGSISPALTVGELLVPDAALIDEGTSGLYLKEALAPNYRCLPSEEMLSLTEGALTDAGAPYRKGPVWSTDAIFRETPSQILRFRQEGAVAVEMEASALFTVGRFRSVAVGAALVVSDDLSELTWKPGFHDPRFVEGRRSLCRGVFQLCQRL